MKNNDFKQKVKNFMGKHGKVAYLIAVLPAILNWVLSYFSDSNVPLAIISLLYAGIITVFVPVLFLGLTREDEFSFQKNFIEEFKTRGVSYLILGVLSAVYLFLWTLLLFVPGFIKSFSYSFAPFIQHDNAQMGANAALKESIRLTKGKKWELFKTYLSYYVWSLVALFFALAATVGIGYSFIFTMISGGSGVVMVLLCIIALLGYLVSIVFSIRALPRWNASLALLYEQWKDENKA